MIARPFRLPRTSYAAPQDAAGSAPTTLLVLQQPSRCSWPVSGPERWPTGGRYAQGSPPSLAEDEEQRTTRGRGFGARHGSLSPDGMRCGWGSPSIDQRGHRCAEGQLISRLGPAQLDRRLRGTKVQYVFLPSRPARPQTRCEGRPVQPFDHLGHGGLVVIRRDSRCRTRPRDRRAAGDDMGSQSWGIGTRPETYCLWDTNLEPARAKGRGTRERLGNHTGRYGTAPLSRTVPAHAMRRCATRGQDARCRDIPPVRARAPRAVLCCAELLGAVSRRWDPQRQPLPTAEPLQGNTRAARAGVPGAAGAGDLLGAGSPRLSLWARKFSQRRTEDDAPRPQPCRAQRRAQFGEEASRGGGIASSAQNQQQRGQAWEDPWPRD